VRTEAHRQRWPNRDWAKGKHGQEDIIVAKFLKTCYVNTVSLERFNKNGMMRWQVNVGSDIPHKDVKIFCFGLTMRIKWAEPTSSVRKNTLPTTNPSKNEFFQ
jgi:hypothetical protein